LTEARRRAPSDENKVRLNNERAGVVVVVAREARPRRDATRRATRDVRSNSTCARDAKSLARGRVPVRAARGVVGVRVRRGLTRDAARPRR
jgi:hypothetical protein